MFSAYGPWALFKSYKSTAKAIANKSGYLMQFNAAGTELGLAVTSDAPLAAFNLSAFDGLTYRQLTMR